MKRYSPSLWSTTWLIFNRPFRAYTTRFNEIIKGFKVFNGPLVITTQKEKDVLEKALERMFEKRFLEWDE